MARSYLTTNAVLDAVFSRLRTTSADHRSRALSWLNSLTVQVANERAWNFLEKEVTIAIVDNVIALPDDFGEENSIEVEDIILIPQNIITDVQAFYADEYDPSGLIGYTVQETGIEFHATAIGNAILNYTARVATYADGDTTVFPAEFLPLMERAILTAWYEYDVDADRMPLSFQLDAALLKQMKKVDNRRKAIPQLNSHGYVRGRG
jgi:hypothetical protein